MRKGARSIRGSLGTYTWVSAGLVVVLALVLWLGPGWSDAPCRVRLAPESDWIGATLEGAGHSWELAPGDVVEVPAGDYRVRLFGADGETEVRELRVLRESSVIGS